MESQIKSFEGSPEKWLMETILCPKKKVVFFVGAGISVDSGIPNFLEFSTHILSTLMPTDWKNKDNEDICRILRPEVLLQIVQQVHNDKSLEFYGALESNKPNLNHYFLALALKAGHCVFTTNVDTLIEQACKNFNIHYNSVVVEQDYRGLLNPQTNTNSPIDLNSKLIKLHGSIEDKEQGLNKYRSIRFTLDRVGLGLTQDQEKVLSAALQGYDFIFLGYSGNDHFSVYPILLKTRSDKTIYWIKFKPNQINFKFHHEPKYFRFQKMQQLAENLSGEKLNVNWEDTSICEVLINRENSTLGIGDTSNLIKKSLDLILKSPNSPQQVLLKMNANSHKIHDPGTLNSPAWVNTVSNFERHLLAAKLLIRIRDLSTRTEQELNLAASCTKEPKELALVEQVRASILSLSRRLGESKPSENSLFNAIKNYETEGDFVSEVEAYLELANIQRINRKFGSAKETLDKAFTVLSTNKQKFQDHNRSLDWPRLMAQLLHYRGLVYGLGQKGTLADKVKGIQYCDEAYLFAGQAGDVSRKAATLNARGLIIYQLAERSAWLLREADSSLDDAFTLYTHIGDARSSFQPLRNRILIQRLRILGSKLQARKYWINKAEAECTRAQNYLKLMNLGKGETSSDQIEIEYRQAQILGLKGDTKTAQNQFHRVLEYWKEKKDLHQQARIWQDLLAITDNQNDMRGCLQPLLSLIESIFDSKTECERYREDLLRLENIRDMLIDAYVKAFEYNDLEYINKIQDLMNRGGTIAKQFDEYISNEFMIWANNFK